MTFLTSVVKVLLVFALVTACHGVDDCGRSGRADFRGENLTAAFHLLGQLNEYQGRECVPGSDLVERFYCDEAAPAASFKSELARFASRQGLADDLTERTVQGCLIEFHSPSLRRALNSLYSFRREEGVWATDPSGRRRRIYRAFISVEQFAGVSREAKLAYLAGAHARFGDGPGAYRFANSQQKTLVVAELLRDVGCAEVVLSRDSGRIPQTTTIRFRPTTELSSSFAQPPR